MATTELSRTTWNIFQVNGAIKDIIENDVDLETGEIAYDISEKLSSLQIAKEELVKNVVCGYKEINAFFKSVEEEKKRVSALYKSLEVKLKKLKAFIRENVGEGEKIKTPQFTLYWIGSSGIEYDEDYLLAEMIGEEEFLARLEKTHPDLVKVTRDLKKTEASELLETTGTLPGGIKAYSRKNLAIK
jgi:hypothetical protein